MTIRRFNYVLYLKWESLYLDRWSLYWNGDQAEARSMQGCSTYRHVVWCLAAHGRWFLMWRRSVGPLDLWVCVVVLLDGRHTLLVHQLGWGRGQGLLLRLLRVTVLLGRNKRGNIDMRDFRPRLYQMWWKQVRDSMDELDDTCSWHRLEDQLGVSA